MEKHTRRTPQPKHKPIGVETTDISKRRWASSERLVCRLKAKEDAPRWAATIKASAIEPRLITTAIFAKKFVNTHAPIPKNTPTRHPINEIAIASSKNCIRTSHSRAPIAMRMPISLVRSVTRLPALVAELVGLKVDVIVTGGPLPTRADKDATSTIPIVMTQVNDPVGNVTDSVT